MDLEKRDYMKYKIEIWRFHRIIDIYENDDIEKVGEWYRKNYLDLFNSGGCTYYLFEDNRQLTFEEERDLDF